MKRSVTVLALASAVTLGACDDGSTGPDGTVPLSLSLVATSSLPTSLQSAGLPPVARSQTYDDGTNSLVIDRVAIVVREVELERLFDDDCDDIPGNDDCEEFETGPFLLELPLDGSVDQVFSIDVPPDTYDEIEFEIDEAGDDDDEDIILRDNPEMDGASIRVEGTWNGEPFVYTSDLDAEQEIEFLDPLVVAEDSGPLNVTLSLDISGWFRDFNGDLIDPNTANNDGPNEDLVEENIENSIEIYEDNDRDGDDDDDDDDDDD
jgi:hypothetical protein